LLHSDLIRKYLASLKEIAKSKHASLFAGRIGDEKKSFITLLSSLLLRSQYLSHSGMTPSATTPTSKPHHVGTKLTRYTLQGGYDKYVALPSQGSADTIKPPVTPQHAGRLLPFSEAILGPERLHHFADAGLFVSRAFRVGWGVDWSLANVGSSLCNAALLVSLSFSVASCGHTVSVRFENRKLSRIKIRRFI
jgi:hypothetical protein